MSNIVEEIRRRMSVGNAEIRRAYKQYVDRKLACLGLEPPDERTHRRFL